MVETNIIDGNFYITTGEVKGNLITHDDNKLVEIFSAKIEYDYQNQAPVRSIPLTGGQIGEKNPFSINIGIKKIVEVISIQGHLEDEDSESAKDKRNNLLTMGKKNRELTIVWGKTGDQTLWKRNTNSQEFGVSITKIKFTETAGKLSESTVDTTPERKIDIQLQLTRGKDLSE